MENIKGTIDEQIKKLSQTEIRQYAEQLIIQKERARQRSKANVQKKKEKGIKQIAVDLPEEILDKFKLLMRKTGNNKTALMCDMVLVYEQVINNNEKEQQQRQQQQNQQNNQQHNRR